MKFFNFELIVRLSKNNPLKAMELFNNIANNLLYKIPTRYKGAEKPSFILNPQGLVNDKTTDVLFKYQYLDLVSRRDYSFYKMYGLKTLPLEYFPELDLLSIRYNPLLKINNQQIYFKYEELTNGN